ncbi:MAG: M23 family metallopeptidase [bacterium]|nr:M23 family metallopeptidase [bacterium]
MKEFLAEIYKFTRLWLTYLSRRARFGFWHFEKAKDLLVVRLVFGRGKMTRPFIHSGMATLVVLGLTIAPLIATSYPSFAQDPWRETPSPSAVLSAAISTEEDTSTLVSDKPRAEIIEYKVKSGDTVSSIAQQHGISIDTVRWANNLKSISDIKPGQVLKILPVPGVIHKVTKGETIYSIAKHYSADAQSVVDFPFNTFVNDETFSLAVGQTLIVPDGVKPAETLWSPSSAYIAKKTPDAGAISATGSFAWPTSGTITQRFSWYHPGIDIANRAAPSVLAADSGTIIAAGWNAGGYGNRVVVDHGNGYRTLYSHFQKIYVSVGQTVKRGDQLGQMGSTGRSTGTHLHFEIHKSSGKLDPLGLLK